ncbi:FecR domain-containing protein [Thalassospira sp. MA62]|nr:FecR domain-containing protein [Thalassospira sp. MA62]
MESGKDAGNKDVMPDQMKKFEIAKSQAFHWAACLDDVDATKAERTAFQEWLAADPLHAKAWDEVSGFNRIISQNAPRLTDIQNGGRTNIPQNDPSGTTVLPRVPTRSEGARAGGARIGLKKSTSRHAAPKRPRRTFAARYALAAGIAGLALFGAQMLIPGQSPTADHVSPVGRITNVVLADGSNVTLGSDTAFSVDYSDNQRHIRLQRGEAYFDVAADPARPFVVSAGARDVRALGTEFDVRMAEETVAVTVAEHSVEIYQPDQDGSGRHVVEQGYGVTYEGAEKPSAPVKQNLHQVLAWREGRLVFQKATLGEVIARLDTYCQQKMVIVDPDLRDYRISVSLDVRDPQKALRSFIRGFDLKTIEIADRLLIVTGRST